MIVINATDRDLINAKNVSSNVELLDVSLKKLRVENNLHSVKEKETNLQIRFKTPYGKAELVEEEKLRVYSGLTLMATIDENEETDIDELQNYLVKIEVEFCAVFNLPEGPMPEGIKKIGFDAFAKLNGPYICMPYIRQAIQNLTSQMGLQITLPIVQIERVEDIESIESDDT